MGIATLTTDTASDRSNKEDDDYVVMSLAKLHNAYFISHDLSIHEHIGEHDAWQTKGEFLSNLTLLPGAFG